MTIGEFVRTRAPLDLSPPNHQEIIHVQRMCLAACGVGLCLCLVAYVATYFGFYALGLTSFLISIKLGFTLRLAGGKSQEDEEVSRDPSSHYFQAKIPRWFQIAGFCLVAVAMTHLWLAVARLGGSPSTVNGSYVLLKDFKHDMSGDLLSEQEYRMLAGPYTRSGLCVWAAILTVVSGIVVVNLRDSQHRFNAKA